MSDPSHGPTHGPGIAGPGSIDLSPEHRQWQLLAEEMSPSGSLLHMAESAKFLVSTIAILGGVVSGFGLLSLTGAPADRWTGLERALIIASSLCAFAGLLCAVGFLKLRVTSINRFNLAEVRSWYEKQVRWARLMTVAGLLLVLSVGSAAAAATLSILRSSPNSAGDAPGDVVWSLQALSATAASEPTSVSGEIRCSSCRPGRSRLVEIRLVSATGQRTCFRAKAMADNAGKFSLTVPSCAVRDGEVEALLLIDNEVVESLPAS